ncbi:hypothetical protein B0J18DRAFT_483584 [Chaetomium sp. MPI-SDFR-AT-0129]|nr:hypothetical protein B0J18DRAFT_483584 [Chaetomium sp. MPI-SDFR-AT-0129]
MESTSTQHPRRENPQMLVQDGLDERGGDLDSAISVQFTSETGSLSTLDPGPEVEANEGLVDSNGLDGVGSRKTGHCPRNAQPSSATKSGWQGDSSMPLAPAPGAASRPPAFSRIEQTSQHLRRLSLNPYLHQSRLRRTRSLLPPLLTSPGRPSRADLIQRSILLSRTSFVSRSLARNLAAIRLSRSLAQRPSVEDLVERCVLPAECLPSPSGNGAAVAPALVARKRAVEKERVKDKLRGWVGSVWKGEVGKRQERAGLGRVRRLTQFWERVGKGERV